MNEVIAIDAAARTVTVAAGITYGELCPYLESKGFALHNLASLPHISVAGACTTATHGSGEKNGNLATAVSGLEFVTAAGDVLKLTRDRDAETFRGAVVGLGALGVITAVTLDIQPTYTMRQYVYENLPLAAMKDHFDAIEAGAYSVSLFTDWHHQRINEVWIKSRVEPGAAFDSGILVKRRKPFIAELGWRAPSKWVCPGLYGCRTLWASRRAPASTVNAVRDNMPSTPSWQWLRDEIPHLLIPKFAVAADARMTRLPAVHITFASPGAGQARSRCR